MTDVILRICKPGTYGLIDYTKNFEGKIFKYFFEHSSFFLFYFAIFAVACDLSEAFLAFSLIDGMSEQRFTQLRRKL